MTKIEASIPLMRRTDNSSEGDSNLSPRVAHLTRKVVAEFIGTFMLLIGAAGSSIINEKTGGSLSSMGLAAASGLTVMIVIMSTGHISGAHLNPAVTIAFAAVGHFPWIQVPIYIVTQLLASVLSCLLLKGMFHPYLSGGVTVPVGNHFQSLLIEFVATFILNFVNTAMATDKKAVSHLAGITVGATVTLNTLVAGAVTGASMNPVRTLGPAIAANNYEGLWVYIVGPVLGALAGGISYCIIRARGEDNLDVA